MLVLLFVVGVVAGVWRLRRVIMLLRRQRLRSRSLWFSLLRSFFELHHHQDQQHPDLKHQPSLDQLCHVHVFPSNIHRSLPVSRFHSMLGSCGRPRPRSYHRPAPLSPTTSFWPCHPSPPLSTPRISPPIKAPAFFLFNGLINLLLEAGLEPAISSLGGRHLIH